MIGNKLLDRCPVCGGELTITGLACHGCDTRIEGEFFPGKLSRLPADQVEFIEVFLRCRGNIKDVERELGISYPTVRNRLDGVLQALGYAADREEAPGGEYRREDVLAALENGEITSEEAARRLRKARR